MKVLLGLASAAAVSLVIAWALTRPASGPEAGERLVPFSASAVRNVVLSDEGGTWTIAQGSDGSWFARVEPTDGAGFDWPVKNARVSSGLRLLADELVLGSAKKPASGEIPKRVLTLTDRAGASVTLRLGAGALAGRVHVGRAISGETVSDKNESWVAIDAESAEIWRTRALALWLDDRPFGCGLLPQPDELRVQTAESDVTLRRRGSRWSLATPVLAPADSEAVGELLDAVLNATGAPSLNDESTAESTPVTVSMLDRSGAWVGVFDESGFGLSRGEVSGTSFGPARFARVDTQPITSRASVEALLAREAMDFPAGDVERVRVDSEERHVSAERGVDGWTEGTQSWAPDLVELLCRRKASRVTTSVPAGWVEDARVSIDRVGGLPAGEVRLGRVGESRAVLAESIVRVYADSDEPIFEAALDAMSG